MPLSREAILDAVDYQPHEVEVPEWGGTVLIRPLTLGGRDLLERLWSAKDPLFRAKVLALGIVGEDGKPLFTQADAQALAEKSASAAERVLDAILRESGIVVPDGQEPGK